MNQPVEAADPRRAPEPRPTPPWWRGVRWFLAEFLVVVTGILCALALNGWAEGRAERRMEASYLGGLEADFERSRGNLEEVVSLLQASMASAEQLLRFTAREPVSVPSDSVLSAVRMLYAYNTFTPVTGAYDNLILAGDLGLIRDARLRAALAQWGGMLERNRHLDDVMTDQYQADSRYFTSAISMREVSDYEAQGLPPGRYRTDTSRVLADPAFENIVVRRHWSAFESREHNARMLAHIDSTLVLIRRGARRPR